MFSSRHGARTSQTAAGRFALQKRAASPAAPDASKRVRDETLKAHHSVQQELFGMSSSELLEDFPLLTDDLFSSVPVERQSSSERVREEMAQLYADFNADVPSLTVVESPPTSPITSTGPSVDELIRMSMHKPGYSTVRASTPVLGDVVPFSSPPVSATGYVWTPAAATGGYTGGVWPQHFAVTAQMVPVQQTQVVTAPVQQVESPFAAYSVQQQVVQQLPVGPVTAITAPAYMPVGRMRGDGADSFFAEPALDELYGNKEVMRVLGTGSDQDVCELWNLCINSPGTEHSCKQAVDVALHMRCACHLLVSGMAKSYADVCRQLGMLADRKCLNGCKHKHACQVGTFYCIACVRGDKHQLDVEQCLDRWLAAGSPIRHGERM